MSESIAYKIIKRAINDIIKHPEKYNLSVLKFAALVKTVGGIKDLESKHIDKLIEQGWDVEDLKINNVSVGEDNIEVWVETPNGNRASVRAILKDVTELNKEEYSKFKQLYDVLFLKQEIDILMRKLTDKDWEIESLRKEIERLRNEKRQVEEYYEEKKKEYDEVFEDARNMLEFLDEKGLLDEYLKWLGEKDREELKSKLLSYYGLIDDDDC